MSNRHESTEASLIRVIRIFASLSLGAMAAFLMSIREVTPRLRLEFSPWSLVAFVAALAFSWFFWRLVFQSEEPSGSVLPSRPRRRAVWFAVLSVVLCLATFAAFGLSLKGIANERIREIIQGAAIAVLTLSFLGFMLWRIGRFLERDSQQPSRPPVDPSGSSASARGIDEATKR